MKKFKQKSDVFITVLLLVGIVAIINFFSSNLFLRFDLTGSKDFSISDVTKKTVAGLDDIVNVKVYFSEKLPSKFISLRQNVADILDNYSNYSGGKVKVEFIDPSQDKEAAKKMYALGIPELQFEVYEKDKLQLVKGYLGMTIQHGDKKETLPVVQDTKSLEYQITLAIKKVTSEEMSVIGMLTSQGSKGKNAIGDVYKNFGDLYNVREIELTDEDPLIPDDIMTLVVAGPTEEFSDSQLQAIDAFVVKGGNLLAMLDGVKIENGLQASPNKTGLEGLLASYGIVVNNDLVLEPQSRAGIASFNQGFFTFSTSYPYWPKVAKDGFDDNSSAVSSLEGVTFPWASSITLQDDKFGEGSVVERLIETSDQSWKVENSFDLNPQQKFLPTASKGKSLLAVEVENQFKSKYGADTLSSSKIIVVSDSDFMTDQLARGGEGLVLVQNLADSLSLDSDLIEVRSKSISSRPIKAELSDVSKAVYRYLNVFGLTFIVLVFGLVRYYLRKKSRFADEF